MAQSATRHLPVDEAHRLRFKREAEIKGLIGRFLNRYTTAEGPHHRPPNGPSKSPRLTVNVGNLIDLKKRTVDARERAETIPNQLSVFMEVNGARLLAEHHGGGGPRAKRTGFSGTLNSLQETGIKGLLFLCTDMSYAMAESPSLRLIPGVCRSKQLTIDGRNCIRSKERMVNTREEVEAT